MDIIETTLLTKKKYIKLDDFKSKMTKNYIFFLIKKKLK